MGCLKRTYCGPEDALEVNPIFFWNALEKNGIEPFFCLNAYRYGFNGMEKDDEVKGTGNHIDFGARGYDPRLGRWLSVDAFVGRPGSENPYNYSLNLPIMMGDPDGNWPEIKVINSKTSFQDGYTRIDVEVEITVIVKVYKNTQSQMGMSKFISDLNEKGNGTIEHTATDYVYVMYDYEGNDLRTESGSAQKVLLSTKMTVNYEFEEVSSIDAVDDSDNLLILSDDVFDNGTKLNGLAGFNAAIVDVDAPDLVRTSIHEMTHTIGAQDLYSKNADGTFTSNYSNALMDLSGYGQNRKTTVQISDSQMLSHGRSIANGTDRSAYGQPNVREEGEKMIENNSGQ